MSYEHLKLNVTSNKHLFSSDSKPVLSLLFLIWMNGITIYLSPNLETLVLFSPPLTQLPTYSQLPNLAASNFKTSFDSVSSKLYATGLK